MPDDLLPIDPATLAPAPQPVIGGADMTAVREALAEIASSRESALRAMFLGRKLKPNVAKTTKDVVKATQASARLAADQLKNAPGLSVPAIGALALPKYDLLKGLNFRELTVPRLTFPASLNVTFGRLVGFNLDLMLPRLRAVLPDWHGRHLTALANVNLGALIGALLDRMPDLELSFLTYNLGGIFNIDFRSFALPAEWYSVPDFSVDIPNFSYDINGLLIENPIAFDLGTLDLPGVDMPTFRGIPGAGRVLKLVVSMLDVSLDDFTEIALLFGDILTDTLVDFVSSALPIVGSVKNGAKAVNAWRKCAKDAILASRVNKGRTFLLPKAALAADALKQLLIERAAQEGTLATIRTTQFATQTAGLFADLGAATGPIVSAAASLAVMCEKLVVLGIEFKRAKAANALLADPKNLTEHLFSVAPILGCYYLTCNTTSDILAVLSADITEDRDWMVKWGENKSVHIDPLQIAARSFIQQSHLKIDPAPPQNFGLIEKRGKLDKLKSSFLAKFRKR